MADPYRPGNNADGETSRWLLMTVQLLGDGAGRWIAEIEIPATGYRDVIRFSDYSTERKAFEVAADMAKYKWRTRGGGDARTELIVAPMPRPTYRTHEEA